MKQEPSLIKTKLVLLNLCGTFMRSLGRKLQPGHFLLHQRDLRQRWPGSIMEVSRSKVFSSNLGLQPEQHQTHIKRWQIP